MTSKTVIQVTANGQLELPPEIRSQLQLEFRLPGL